MCIGAHPDDIELFCSGTLLRFFKDSEKLFFVGAKCADEIQDPDSEAVETAKMLNAQLYFGLGKNARQHESLPVIVEMLTNHITDFNPDLIFTHSGDDHHQDHRTLYEATLSALRRHDGLTLGYHTWSWMAQEYDLEVIVDQEEKNKLIRTFRSQKKRLDSYPYRIFEDGRERFSIIKWRL